MTNEIHLPQCEVEAHLSNFLVHTHGCAKVILFGEHGVVYGRRAIGAAIQQGAYACAQFSSKPSCLHIVSWNCRVDKDEKSELGTAFRALLRACKATEPNLHVDVEVEVPGGFGLGCSAAMGVAITRAIYARLERSLDDDTTIACALAWERVFHGNPSGIDVTAATLGTTLLFQRDKPPQPIHLHEPIELAIVSTGKPSSTKKMVEHVAKQRKQNPLIVERRFDEIDTLSIKAVDALKSGQWYEVGSLMNLNHALLASLMLSTEALEQACEVAQKAGALGAKLTGAGGGGCAIALAPGCSEAVVDAWQAIGLHGFTTKVSI